MACSLNGGLNISGLNDNVMRSRAKRVCGFCPKFDVVRCPESKRKGSLRLRVDFMGKPLVLSDQKGFRNWRIKAVGNYSLHAQASICVSRPMRWWEKTLKTNMIEIHSAQELVDSLLNAGDNLVVIDFYSPGCGGCKTLHPKICQLAESNPSVIILKVNLEELKTMCHSLHVHVLPFFRFYRGAEGRVCSFSCTNATIKKFKDALAKYGSDRSSLGPAKGLDEYEILKLKQVGELSITSPVRPAKEENSKDLVIQSMALPDIFGKTGRNMGLKDEIAGVSVKLVGPAY
ncbi:hypothetical protein K2173_028153 [Erythroxylum novogranatense]|uniref:Thioredoxin domain-containing protein n=1 Tax=Erythroxylum novogranatense TaxID=1862640 RepID=A0AAV8U126_9ROSI|nr:hypothetical protein K2173_028153 [Erythroxylum novogranatense]